MAQTIGGVIHIQPCEIQIFSGNVAFPLSPLPDANHKNALHAGPNAVLTKSAPIPPLPLPSPMPAATSLSLPLSSRNLPWFVAGMAARNRISTGFAGKIRCVL